MRIILAVPALTRRHAPAAVWTACRAGGEALLVLAATGALSAGALLLR